MKLQRATTTRRRRMEKRTRSNESYKYILFQKDLKKQKIQSVIHFVITSLKMEKGKRKEKKRAFNFFEKVKGPFIFKKSL